MIVILGSKGLLGSHICALYPKLVVGLSREQCDITQANSVYDHLKRLQPEFVINAAGVVPKAITSSFNTYRANALAPHIVRTVCDELDCKLIQISTDCVFNGWRGNYYEDDPVSPVDDYGLSKALGESYTDNHTIIRSSFVGYPDPNGRGLLSWLSQQTAAYGWTNVLWNGVTTVALAQHIMSNIIYGSDYGGLQHYFSITTQSKHDLLAAAAKVYGWKVDIIPVDEPISNKTLCTNGPLEYMRPFDEMLQEMVSKEKELEKCVY